MKELTRWIRQLRDRISSPTFPRMITLADFAELLCFKVYNPVERYRIEAYGGEREVLQRFLALLGPGDVVYDIGASVGLYTVAVATFLRQGVVYAFEPDPTTRARLEENVGLNQLNNVYPVAWAASDREGEAILYTDGVSGFAPSMAAQQRPGAPRGQVAVSTRSIDSALSRNELPVPDVLKIDIEGAEGLCLAGSKRLLGGQYGQRPRALMLELHPGFLPAFGTSPEEIKGLIESLGYELNWSQLRAEQEHLCYLRVEQSAPGQVFGEGGS